MTEHADVLEALIQSAGWQLFAQHLKAEWGPVAYANRLKAAVQRARDHGTDASHAIELVDAGNEAIAEAMRWPGEELARLRRSAQAPELTMSRRGPL